MIPNAAPQPGPASWQTRPPSSLDRRAAGCAAVALATTRTIPAARRALETVREAEVRAAATALLDDLSREPAGGARPCQDAL
jgi:hypothetical protein